uniref:T9SS type A sorting domain-containing protein n=1 Tax=Fulvivirga sp. TaxID=1931237 RepID=UPI004049807F
MRNSIIYIAIIALLSFNQLTAQSNSPYLIRSTVGLAGTSELVPVGDKTYIIQQSIGQVSSIGTFNANGYTLRQGFIQPLISVTVVEKELPLVFEANVYPNPFIEDITISFFEEITGEVKVYIYDLRGVTVFKETYFDSNEIQISLWGVSEAPYILKILYNGDQFIRKIIKK